MGRKKKIRPPKAHEIRPFTGDTVFLARLWYLGRCAGCTALHTLNIV